MLLGVEQWSHGGGDIAFRVFGLHFGHIGGIDRVLSRYSSQDWLDWSSKEGGVRYYLVCVTLLCGFFSGCGTATPDLTSRSSESLRPPRVEYRGGSYLIDLPPEGEIRAIRLPGTPQSIFSRVAEVYEELGIPVEILNTRNFLIGNANHRVRRRIGELSMSRIVDCGVTISGSRASRDMIVMDLRTQVTPVSETEVSVETLLIATARSTDGASTNEVNCSSLGRLERYIVEGVIRRLGS